MLEVECEQDIAHRTTRLHNDLSSTSISVHDQISSLRHYHSFLESQAASLQQDELTIESSIYNDAFAPFLLLAPFMASSNREIAQLSLRSIDLFILHSSAKEVLIALEECLTNLVSRDDDVDEEEGEQLRINHVGESSDAAASTDYTIDRVTNLINCYPSILPRIKAKNPIRFLQSANESILSIITNLNATQSLTYRNSWNLVQSVTSYITLLQRSDWLISSKSMSISLFRSLLFSTIAELHRHLPMDITQRYFLSHHPHYRIPNRERFEITAETNQAWAITISCAFVLDLKGPESVFELLRSDLMVLPLLSHMLSIRPEPSLAALGSNSFADLLSRNLASLISSSRHNTCGEDEFLFILWWFIQHIIDASETLDDEVIFPLIELLTPISTLSPSSKYRFLSFRLISSIVLHVTSSESIQLILVKDFLQNSPFSSFKIASISLLKEIWLSKIGKQSLFNTKVLLNEFEEDLLILDLGREGEEDEEVLVKFMLERLGFVYLLLSKDRDDSTGIWARLSRIEKRLLAPIRGWCSNTEDQIQMGIVKMALDRVQECISAKDC